TIAVPMQTGMEYGMLVDGAPWERLYTAATDFVLSETGKTAAVVQTAGLGQADLEGFSKGIYTIAVDGEAWEECYLNAWSPCFDREGHRVASTVRVTPYEYTISINGQRWSETYPCAWEPIFEPKSGDVIAPIRKEGKWGLARNGSLFWKPMFAQCWAPQAAATDGEYIWAVAAPSYGAFTVACNATPWNCRFPSVTDLVLSSDGKHAAALGSQNNSRFQIAVDGKVWDDAFDMAWPVVFSPAGDRAAAKVRRDGKFALYVDGNAVIENLDGVWNPTFSPDGTVLLFCSLKDGVFSRHTVRL
ncbi:MAG: TolB family protein, partial [Bilophila wadsworthia]